MKPRALRIRLPDLSAEVGHPVVAYFVEPPASEFFRGAPDVFVGTECYRQSAGAERLEYLNTYVKWKHEVVHRLAACMHRKPFRRACGRCHRAAITLEFSPDDIDVAFTALVRAWRWKDEDEAGGAARMPNTNGRAIIRSLAERTNRLPHELWALPVSDLMFDYRILFERDAQRERRRGTAKATKRYAMNDPDMQDAIPAHEIGIDVG